MVTPRLEVEDFNALTDRASAFAEAAFIARWGSGPALRKGALRGLVTLLLRRPGFIHGKRVAYSAPKLAKALKKDKRTVERAIEDLRLFPELVTVEVITSGEPNWRDRRSWFTHLEYRAGDVLRAELDEALTSLFTVTPGVTSATPRRHADSPPGVTPVDQDPDPPLDLELQLKERTDQPLGTDRLNFEVDSAEHPSPLPPAAHDPAPPPLATATPLPDVARIRPQSSAPLEHSALPSLLQRPPRRLTGPAMQPVPARPGLASAQPRPLAPHPRPQTAVFTHPLQLIEAVIRQHRRLVERKSPFVPISPDQHLLVDGALRWLTWCRTDQEKLELCAHVSKLAAQKAAEKGKLANLQFTFGGLPGQPYKFFLERAADVRASQEQMSRQFKDAALTATVLGTPPPLKPPPASPLPRPFTIQRRTEPPARDNNRIPPLQLAALYRQKQAELARAG